MAIGRDFRFFVDGVDLAKAFTSVSYAFTRDALDNTTLDTTGSRTYEAGLKTATFSFSGVFDSDVVNADEIDDVMRAAYSAGTTVQLTGTDGTALTQGDSARMIHDGTITSWSYPADVGGLLMCEGEIQGDQSDVGYWVFVGTDSTAGTNGASVDDSASSTNGLIFQAHLYEEADSAATDMDITLQHSTDDAVWADLIALQSVGDSFGTVSGVIDKGVTINRYLRVVIQATGGKGYVAAAVKRF